MSSQVFVMNQGTTKSLDLESKWSDNLAQPIKDFSKGTDLARYMHKTKEVNYFPLTYDRYRNLFYRIHKSSIQTTEESPKFYLSVIDSSLEKLAEFRFAEGYYIFPIVTKEGLMFSAINKHDDKLELIRYCFSE